MISRIIDWIDRAVNPNRYDPLSIKNNHYNQWGPPAEEKPVTFLPYNQTSAANQATNLYQQALGQQTAGYTLSNPGVLGAAGGGSYITTAGNLGGVGVSQSPYYSVPQRTGYHYSILFVDAAGNHHTVVVDQAHAGILQQIGGMTSGGVLGNVAVPFTPYTSSQPKMLEGDFSFDEMEAAENLIAELSSGRNQGNEQGQDAGCAAEG